MKHAIKCFNIALSETTGLNNIYIKKYEAGGHLKILDQPKEVGVQGVFKPEYIQTVLTFKLDDFLSQTQMPFPNYIKIDVDGAELMVLKGMTNVLRNLMLRSVFIELEDSNPETKDCINLLIEAGFSQVFKKQVQRYCGLNNYIFRRS